MELTATGLIEFFGMLGEWAIAGVILYELERNALDTFFQDTGEGFEERRKIYDVYCGLDPINGPRNQQFVESLRDLFPAPWGVKYSRERVYS